MSQDYEDLSEQLKLVYRLKEQAEQSQHRSDLFLRGMRAVLEADCSESYTKKCTIYLLISSLMMLLSF